MQIRRVYGRKKLKPEPSALRRFVTTPTGCRGCDAVRRIAGAALGIGKKKG